MEVELFAYKDGYAGTHFKELRPATDEEIKASHPKCGTCRHSWYRRPDQLICDNNDGHWDGEYEKIDPFKSYCMHWEAKT